MLDKLKGYRLLALGVLTIAIGFNELVELAPVKAVVGEKAYGWALLVIGVVVIVLRVVTNTPVGTSKPE